MMQHKPNMIKLAITAAGGRERVANEFGRSAWGVGHWTKTDRMPVEFVQPLANLGGNVVSAEQLLTYMREQAQEKAAEKAAA